MTEHLVNICVVKISLFEECCSFDVSFVQFIITIFSERPKDKNPLNEKKNVTGSIKTCQIFKNSKTERYNRSKVHDTGKLFVYIFFFFVNNKCHKITVEDYRRIKFYNDF